jgi:hypothetical protein
MVGQGSFWFLGELIDEVQAFCGPSRSDARQRRRNFADHDEEEAALVGAERGPIKRKSPQQTAATDAYEEAGVHGAGDKRIVNSANAG